MEGFFAWLWENLAERFSGPMWLRLVLQPAVAAFFAIRDGLKDAREGKPAYFWEVFSNKAHRRELIRDGWKSIAKVFVMAMVMDTIYQLIVQHWIYPLEIVAVAFVLAVIPYVLFRGPINRIFQRFARKDAVTNNDA